MKKYEITAYIDGVKKSRIVKAENKEEAEKIGWALFDADSIYVSEVEKEDYFKKQLKRFNIKG